MSYNIVISNAMVLAYIYVSSSPPSFSLPHTHTHSPGRHGKTYREVKNKYKEPQTIHESFQVGKKMPYLVACVNTMSTSCTQLLNIITICKRYIFPLRYLNARLGVGWIPCLIECMVECLLNCVSLWVGYAGMPSNTSYVWVLLRISLLRFLEL